jgi:hypothetical protein
MNLTEVRAAISLGVGVTGGVAAWLPTLEIIVRIGAGLAGLVASLCAAYYYIKKS